jgi:NAD-dependent SIR2 family protein deacetylase
MGGGRETYLYCTHKRIGWRLRKHRKPSADVEIMNFRTLATSSSFLCTYATNNIALLFTTYSCTLSSKSRRWGTNTSNLYQTRDACSSIPPEKTTIESIAESLRSNAYKKVLVVSGAGVSVAAGIPDFRSPGSGLYDNLHKYNLPYPEAIFDVDFYNQNPQPFVTLAKEIWPGVNYRPTLTHCFFSLLDKKGILSRVYTQNIDGLEAVAGVTDERLVECHGNFRSSACIKCRTPFDAKVCQSTIIDNGEAPKCNSCGGLVKPDIVFFGEVMPSRFSDLVHYDVASSDLVIVLGSSLLVSPVCHIPDWVKSSVPRLLINRDLVGTFGDGKGTDVFMQGDCDDSVRQLCRLVGWEDELDAIYASTHSQNQNDS